MSDNRKYYYLKLKENFYNSETMVILESICSFNVSDVLRQGEDGAITDFYDFVQCTAPPNNAWHRRANRSSRPWSLNLR